MPTEVHDGAQGPPRRPNGDTTTSPGAAVTGATPENLRPNVVAVLREFGIIPDHPLGKPNARPDETSLSGDVDENEPGISIAYPVIATGEQLKLAQQQESNRGKTIIILLGMLAVVLIGTVAACLRLPPDQSVDRLTDLTNTLLLALGAALGYYFGRKTT